MQARFTFASVDESKKLIFDPDTHTPNEMLYRVLFFSHSLGGIFVDERGMAIAPGHLPSLIAGKMYKPLQTQQILAGRSASVA